jgi:hypothetical protein
MFANAGDAAGITPISRDLLDIIAHGVMLVIMNSLPGLTSAAAPPRLPRRRRILASERRV